MVDLDGGEYFALDATAARMWELLVAGQSPAEVASTLAEEYDVSTARLVDDCTGLAEELVARGLLMLVRR